MNKPLKNLIVFLALWLMGETLAAQDKIDAISPKSKEANEKLKNAPAAGSPLGLATPETKASPAPGSDAVPIPEQKAVVTRRDPFRPFTLGVGVAPARKRDHLSPLERVELGQLTLVGVVADKGNFSALVEDASGLGYVVKVGTPMGSNDGKVIAIKRERIVIEENYVDFFGAKKKREINMKLTPESAE